MVDQKSDLEQLFLKSIIENIPNMVFVKDATELRFVLFNRAGEELLGIRANDLIGKNDFDLFPESEAQFFVAKDREVLRSGQLLDIDSEPIQTANGPRVLHTKKIPLLDANGEPKFLLGISEDITDRKAAEEELKNAYAEAEAANQAKSDFLSRVSHELRTPINAILGFAQLSAMDASAEQQHQMSHVLEAGRHLLELVDDVLDIASVESGKFSVELESVDLQKAINDCLLALSGLATENKVDLQRSVDCDVRVRADGARLRQIMTSLLTNAIRYNKPNGSVTIKVERANGRAIVRVTDTGLGIDEAALDQVFQPFERLDAPKLGITGTGLGLSVSRSLAEAMGASLSVESEKDTGSCFSLDLCEVNLTPRVLYIEDNLSNIELMRAVFGLYRNVELLVAEDGETGLDVARAHHPELILLDLNLPGINGDEVLSAVMADSSLRNTPVVIVSADATPLRIDDLLARGATKYLTKPFEIDDISALIRSLMPAGELIMKA